jgi:hypothetical protein
MSRRSAPSDGTSRKRASWDVDVATLLRRRDRADEPVEHVVVEPTLPSVNLLPRSVRDAMRTAHLRRIFALLVLLVVAATVGVWLLQADRIARAQADVDRARMLNEQVRTDLEALSPVRTLYEQITRLQGVVTDTLASQPTAEAVIREVLDAGQAAGGGELAFSSIDVVYTGIPVAGDQLNACPNPNPFTAEITIGCISFTASASSREQVSELLRLLEVNPLFVGPFVTTSTVATIEGEGDVVAFSGSAGVSTYGLATPLTADEIDALLAPPAAEPASEGGPADAATDVATPPSEEAAP